MIVWLSSFPRSGKTFVRLMLKRVWDVSTCSMYDDRDDCVKTHDIPIDQGKSIYVVRDGRSASNSYRHYQRDFGPPQDAATLADVLIDFTPYGSWSDHLDAWEPLERPNTLVLRYEQLICEPEEQIRRIADFLELRPRHGWKNDFETLQRLERRFFRDASREPLVALGDAIRGDSIHCPRAKPGRTEVARSTNARNASSVAQAQALAEDLKRQLTSPRAESRNITSDSIVARLERTAIARSGPASSSKSPHPCRHISHVGHSCSGNP